MTHHNRFRPRLDAFEDRLVPAGNVTVSFGEVLEIRGDEAANKVRVVQSADGTITVRGLDGTRINGQAKATGAGPIEKLDVLLFGGNDRLEVNNLVTVDGDQNIETGAGNDTVVLDGVRPDVNLTVKTDGGLDKVVARNVVVGGDFFLDTGSEKSDVTIVNAQVGKSLTVIGGLLADTLAIRLTTTGEDLNVQSKEGNDRVEIVDTNAGKNLTANLGNGDDFAFVRNARAAFDATLLGEDADRDTLKNRGFSGETKTEIKGFERTL